MAGNKYNTEFKPIKITNYTLSFINPNTGQQSTVQGTAIQIIKFILNQQT
jgi:hypothetical protein